MGSVEVESCIEILHDHFGEIVASLGRILLTESASLPVVVFRANKKLKLPQIRRALVILEQHNIVKFVLKENRIVYSIEPVDVLRLVRSTRCSLIAKKLYGQMAEAIVEELLYQGRLTCSDCIRRVATRLEAPLNEIKTQFARLCETQMIMRCENVVNTLDGCPIMEKAVDPFLMPHVILDGKDESSPSASTDTRKRKLAEEKPDSDASIYWRLNWLRFERYMRDEFVVEAACSDREGFENNVKTLRALLKISELKADSKAASSYPISIHDVVRTVNANQVNMEKKEIEVSLRMLSDDESGIVRKVGDSAGGLYIVDFEKAITLQCQWNLESVAREKIDSRAVRIIRLLLQKGYLSEEQIEKYAMLSSKETKELCYALLDHHLISIRHVPKTQDFAPARTFYLYHVELCQIAQGLYLESCRVLRNVIIRRRHQTKQNKALIDRHLKMETILANIEADANLDEASKRQQMLEVENMYMTAADRTNLEQYRRSQLALFKAEIELDKSILICSLFIEFARRRL
ncbi:hypothetical protein AB6A40_005443 [Gnathostoma spinigerum]|uniref:DNA-directed RNA polymerase III subunit RPC3 n=1 Tax=Gnathostoma spinigerum TaxID=75299 RepID=A0ABD6EFG6_9BILA